MILFARLYQQLQPSAAEPGVSWCLVNDQKTPGHTPAHIYIPAAPMHPTLPTPLPPALQNPLSVDTISIFALGTQHQPTSTLLSSSCFFICTLLPPSPCTHPLTPCGRVICALSLQMWSPISNTCS